MLCGQQKPTSVTTMLEEILGCKWSVLILALLSEGPKRPSEILKACPGLSAKVLHERLKKMIGFAIVERAAFGEKPPFKVEYFLSAFGRRFTDVLSQVRSLEEELRQKVSDHQNR